MKLKYYVKNMIKKIILQMFLYLVLIHVDKETSVASFLQPERQIDAKCKKDARDRLLRNRSGLLGYARFSPYDQRRGLSCRFY